MTGTDLRISENEFPSRLKGEAAQSKTIVLNRLVLRVRLAQLPQQLALEVEKDWICDFFSHYISLVRILVGNRTPIMSSRIF